MTNRRVGGEIQLLHDGDFRRLGGDRLHLLAALEYWLPRWRDSGFESVTRTSSAAPREISFFARKSWTSGAFAR